MLDDEALSGLALSESTLSRDWLSDEEDAAWAHLQPELSLGEFRKRHFVNFPFVLSPELAEGSKDERKIALRGCAQDRLVEVSSTASRRPVVLAWCQECVTREEALSAEQKIKGWSRKKKEAMMRGDWAEVSRLARRSF